MATELDRKLEEAYQIVTGPGGQIEVGEVDYHGHKVPIITNAPPSLPFYFAHFCAQHGDAIFLVDGDERLSFADTYTAARAVAGALVDGFGLQRGERVGIAMRNAPAWIVTYMGVVMAGGVATLLNGWWQGEELADGIADTETRLVLADSPRAQRLATSGSDHGAEVVTIDVSLPIMKAIAPLTERGGSVDSSLPMVLGDDLATIIYTSGSTGQSKGAWSTHRAVTQGIFNYLVQTLSVLTILTKAGQAPTGQPSTLLNVPLFHVTAEIPVMLQSFAMGRKLVMMPKWDAEEAMRLIEEEKVTYFVGVPLMSYEMLVHPNRGNYDLSSCTSFAAGGAPRPPEHVKKLSEGMGGGQPLLGYGLTETNAIGCGNINENYLAKPTSTGPATKPLVDLRIMDEAGNEVAQGSVGEVCIRSIANFEGYWNNQEATDAAFTKDRYFRTGDLGYVDEDGYLFIVDRKKDIIIRGGENISCQEVEAAIYAHPDVAECAVFGLPDERLGEIPGAVVHFHPDTHMTSEELCDFLKSHVAAFKVPQHIWISETALPRLGTEKIDKVALRNRFRALFEAKGIEAAEM